MDFRHIKAFIAVADALSVTKAAERLHISQPPLSRHIHQLEEELGLTLFLRHRQGVTLTEDGKRLLEKARALDAAGTEFAEIARQMARGEQSRIRIGIGWGLWDVVNRLRVEFTKQHPDVTFEVRDVYCSDDCQEHLRNSTLDLVFTRPPFDETIVDAVPIFHERIQAVVADDSPFASRQEVRVRELANVPLLLWDRHMGPALYDRVLELYARNGVTPPMVPTPGAGSLQSRRVDDGSVRKRRLSLSRRAADQPATSQRRRGASGRRSRRDHRGVRRESQRRDLTPHWSVPRLRVGHLPATAARRDSARRVEPRNSKLKRPARVHTETRPDSWFPLTLIPDRPCLSFAF